MVVVCEQHPEAGLAAGSRGVLGSRRVWAGTCSARRSAAGARSSSPSPAPAEPPDGLPAPASHSSQTVATRVDFQICLGCSPAWNSSVCSLTVETQFLLVPHSPAWPSIPRVSFSGLQPSWLLDACHTTALLPSGPLHVLFPLPGKCHFLTEALLFLPLHSPQSGMSPDISSHDTESTLSQDLVLNFVPV